MNSKQPSPLLFILFLIVLAASTRIIPHWPNFTAMGAMALFGAAYLRSFWLALLIPFAALYMSDLIINNVIYASYYDHFVWQISPFVYLAFALLLGIGYLLRNRVKTTNVIFASLSASVVFFIVTNSASWLIDPMYAKNFAGYLTALGAGIPFFWNTLAGDLFYCGVLFGGYALVRQSFPALAVR